MLRLLIRCPELRCTARSRRSGWQQCGRLAAYGSRVCTTHGARKVPRVGADAPNFKHGNRSLATTVEAKQSLQRIRLLKLGVDAMNGSNVAASEFDAEWTPLLARQEHELAELRGTFKQKRGKIKK